MGGPDRSPGRERETVNRDLSAVRSVIVRAPNWIGDAVMATPTLSALHAGCPHASITVLAKSAVAEVLAHHPAITDFVIDEAPGRHAGPGGRLRLAQAVRARRFDAGLLLTNSFGSALVLALARIPIRVGYRTDGRAWCLTAPLPVPPRSRTPHMTEYYLHLIAPWNLVGDPRAVSLTVTDRERETARARLAGWGVAAGEAVVAINPGAAYGSAKRWPPDRFAELARRLTRHGVRVLLVGSAAERPIGAAIGAGLGTGVLDAMGRTTLREAMALLLCCRRVVTNDSGPMHVAAALGVPVTAIFGPTDARVTGPVGERVTRLGHPVECSPCRYRECPVDHGCMTGVTVDEVYESAISS